MGTKIVVLFRAPTIERQVDFHGTMDELLQKLLPFESLINFNPKERSALITPSLLSQKMKTDPAELFEILICQLCPPPQDPRLLIVNHPVISFGTEVDNEGRYRYMGYVDGKPVVGIAVGNQQEVAEAIEFYNKVTEASKMLVNFLASVQPDFPTTPVPLINPDYIPDVAQEETERAVETPAFLPAEEPGTPPKKIEVQPRVLLSELMNVNNEKDVTPKKKGSALLVAKKGGPWLEILMTGPDLYQLPNNGFLNTLESYLVSRGVLMKHHDGDASLMLLNQSESAHYETILRSALRDHNLLDGVTFDRKEYSEARHPDFVYL